MITRFLLALTVAFFVTSSQARGSELDRVFDLYYADRYEEAFPPMLSLAQSGVAEAQGAIARMFLNGWGTSKDERAAFYWASRGAESKESESEAVLGWIHWAGAAGFKQDYAKSLYWYERAVSRGGNLGALGSLALLHLELSNPDQAEALTERLVSKKDFSTVFFLASSLEQSQV